MNSRYYINIFCKNVKYLRKKHGLSKAEMARRLNIGVGSITLLEKGILPDRLISAVLLKIEEIFSVQPAVLLSKILEDL